MDKNTATNLIESTFNQSFDEARFELFAKNFLNDIEPKSNSYSGQYIWDDYKEHVNTYKRIGKYIDPDGEALDILIVEVKSVLKLERARTALRNFVIKHLVKFEKDYALVAFYSKQDEGADWRFSFIKLEHQAYIDEEKGKVKTRKEFTPAKRYSFLVGKYEKAYTAKNQLLPLLQNVSSNATIEEIESAFSIEKVTDEFFNQYKELFVKLYEHFDNDVAIQNELVKSNIDTSRFTKKLLGQIVFLYFLQKKGWLGVPKDKTWGNGQKRFMQQLFDTSVTENKNFFKDYLQFLFYEALAKERDNVNSYYAKFDCRIPFLNGGLFEAEYDWKHANISIPETIFRNEEKNKSGDVGTGILDVFDRYNFTIKEDEPLDKEVAVDPEMLGKVFENMLEVTERKSKGAFYTPREIVHYMCQESLIHYLDNSLNTYTETFQEIGNSQTNMFGNEGKKGQHTINLSTQDIKVPKTDIEHFIRNGHFALEHDQRVVNKGKETAEYKYILPESIRQHADSIDKKLTEIKICDPAIGSGAFPVGLLHELVNAHLVIKPHLTKDYLATKLKTIIGKHNGEEQSESRYIYRLKRHIIQESIYGVDIDASAIDIARLRLWLSLVVDEDDFEPIETLPNLDYKIVCGNSLIGLPRQGASRYPQLSDELEKLKDKFYSETNEIEKKSLRNQINKKIQTVLKTAEDFEGYKIDFDFKLFFSEVWRENGGFDVVIGNPPYVQIKQISENNKKLFKGIFRFTNGRFNLFYLFIELSPKLLTKKGVTSLIIPDRILLNTQCGDIRRWLIKENDLIEIDSFESQVFASAVVDSVILTFKNQQPLSDYFTSRYNCTLETLHSKKPNRIPNSYVLNSPSNQFDLNYNYFTDLTIQKIRNNAVQLEHIADTKDGIIQSKIPDHLFLEEKINDKCKKLLFGKDIEQYKLTYQKHWVHYDIELMKIEEDKRGGGGLRMRNSSIFERSKILTRQTSDRIIGAFDENGEYYYSNTLHGTHITNSLYNPKFVLAQLNSDVMTFYYKKTTNEEGKVFAQIKIELLKMMPIKYVSNQEIFISLVNYLEQSKKVNNNSIEYLYFQSVLNSLVFEIHFPVELKSANKEILKHLGDLKPITDTMSDEEKLAVIQSEFERLYDPNHPVRNNLETLDSIEEVRIIKEALK